VSFCSVVLDVDSTISGIEGFDWLAARRDEVVARDVAQLTARCMSGERPLEEVYAMRLELIRPTRAEVDELALEYERALAPGVVDAVSVMRDAGVRMTLVSGGIRQALEPLAAKLGFTRAELFAVRVTFDAAGNYAGFDMRSPLSTTTGKADIVQGLYLPRPVLAVGDGITDLAMRSVADAFAAFTGFARRIAVVRSADHELTGFDQLPALVLS
jgi:phosphoserine phosphatase